MPSVPRPARPIRARHAAGASIALLLLAGLAGCGGGEPMAEPAPSEPAAIELVIPPAPKSANPPSSFSLVVDEAIRRKKVIERLKQILRESEP